MIKLFELEDDNQQLKLFVDLDGVLADFVKGYELASGNNLDQYRYHADSKYRNQTWKWVEQHGEQGGKLWRDLPPMADAAQLWDYVKSHNPTILTATGKPKYGAEQQKKEWFAQHFDPSVPMLFTRKSAEKASHAKPGHVLIDDQPKSIDPWVAAGGIGILHTSAADTINQLKKLGI